MSMIIEMRRLSDIKPYPGNPRNNDAAVDVVAASIREFGFRQPVVVDEADVIIVGHTRYRAAEKLGLAEVPVHVARDLTPDQVRAYRLADNKTSEAAEWDYDLLPIELSALQEAGCDLGLLGFNEDELADLLDPGAQAGLTDPDEVPDAAAEATTQAGDLWLLGHHRLLCGDATQAADLDRLMDGAPADLLLTDPPYGVKYVGKTADALTIENDAMEGEEYRRFLTAAFTAGAAHLRPGGSFYIWHADTAGLPTRWACSDAGLTVRQCLVWIKNTMVLGRQDYQWRHEPCLHGWAEGASHTWLSDRTQTTVLQFDKPARSADHPTMKPVALFAYLIGNSCRVGKIVLDLFAGSGTTLIAAEQTGRKARLLELDPTYCDVVVQRWERYTGRKAERVPRGSPTLAGVGDEGAERTKVAQREEAPRGGLVGRKGAVKRRRTSPVPSS
jgi:DNA modification methylase